MPPDLSGSILHDCCAEIRSTSRAKVRTIPVLPVAHLLIAASTRNLKPAKLLRSESSGCTARHPYESHSDRLQRWPWEDRLFFRKHLSREQTAKTLSWVLKKCCSCLALVIVVFPQIVFFCLIICTSLEPFQNRNSEHSMISHCFFSGVKHPQAQHVPLPQ